MGGGGRKMWERKEERRRKRTKYPEKGNLPRSGFVDHCMRLLLLDRGCKEAEGGGGGGGRNGPSSRRAAGAGRNGERHRAQCSGSRKVVIASSACTDPSATSSACLQDHSPRLKLGRRRGNGTTRARSLSGPACKVARIPTGRLASTTSVSAHASGPHPCCSYTMMSRERRRGEKTSLRIRGA